MADIDFMKLYFTPIPLLETVPNTFREACARTNSTVYDWIHTHSVGTTEHNAGLYWELLLHKVLLRKPSRTSRGRKGRPSKPHDTIQQRFNLFEIGDFRTLIR